MRIKDLSKFERPREKLARYGVGKLADHELLAIVLGSGVAGTNVVQLAKKIVAKVKEIGIEQMKLDDLSGITGLGPVKAGQVFAALEFGRRQYAKEEIILTPEKVFELCADIRDSRKEHLIAFYLNSRGALIEREVISIGILDASLVHPREIFEPALRHGAFSVILAHNHPSGNLECSADDIEVTGQLQHAGKILGMKLDDHLVVTSASWKSILVNII